MPTSHQFVHKGHLLDCIPVQQASGLHVVEVVAVVGSVVGPRRHAAMVVPAHEGFAQPNDAAAFAFSAAKAWIDAQES